MGAMGISLRWGGASFFSPHPAFADILTHVTPYLVCWIPLRLRVGGWSQTGVDT